MNCADCGFDGPVEKSASGQMYCSDMIACLYRSQIPRKTKAKCRFCSITIGLESVGYWNQCIDRGGCGNRFSNGLNKRREKKEYQKRLI